MGRNGKRERWGREGQNLQHCLVVDLTVLEKKNTKENCKSVHKCWHSKKIPQAKEQQTAHCSGQ